MTDVAIGREGPGCSGCGAPLPRGECLRDVTCGHCRLAQPHPEPLPAGQAVLMPGSLGHGLGRVVRCEGADAVTVQPEKGQATTLPLESLVPVIPAERVGATAGERVFAREMHGFKATWLVSLGPSTAVVKHPNDGFQSAFFDRKVPSGDVYVPARPERRERRAAGAGWSGFAILGVAFDLVGKAIYALVGLFFLVVFGALAVAYLRARLGG